MARISRKQLKEDRFAQEVTESVEYFTHHRKQVLVLLVIAVLLVLGGTGYWRYRESRKTEARHAFQEGMNLYYGQVSADPRPGVVTFATHVEKNTRTAEALQDVAERFSRLRYGQAARYYLALLDLQQGNDEEARTSLEALLGASDEEVAALARLALGELLEREEKPEEAHPHYEYLVNHPSRLIPKSRAQLKLAALLVEHDPEAARPILEELAMQPPAVAGQARTLLAQLESE